MEAFDKEILIAVIGLTPQIITETLYYLTQIKKPPARISEIYVITTLPGKNLIYKKLLAPLEGKFYSFCKDYSFDLTSIRFDESGIIVLKDQEGKPLEDIRTREDNELIADQILDFIRQMTSDPSTRLYCSIAGGRKTQSLYLGFALQLYGRPQDSLLHVLVTPEFEAHPEFFYPTKEGGDIRSKNGKVLNPGEACVDLAEIPFIRLREKFSLKDLENLSFKPTIKNIQSMLDSLLDVPPVMIDLKERSLSIGQALVKLDPIQIVLYNFLAMMKKQRCRKPEKGICGGCVACYVSMEYLDGNTEDLLRYYGKIYNPNSGRYAKLKAQWEGGPSWESIRSHFAKINNRILEALKVTSAQPLSHFYIIESTGLYGSTRYGIRVDKEKIEIIE